MKQDLVISAYKPVSDLASRFGGTLRTSTNEDAWAFVRAHLKQLPVFVRDPDGTAEVIAERRANVLYDRTVAFFVQHQMSVPVAPAAFAAGLADRFPERDDMYFLPAQVAEYDRKRVTVRELRQLPLMVTDESTAIEWLRQELTRKPQTQQDLTPKFLREIDVSTWNRYEQRPELLDLLRRNFLRQEHHDPLAPQIVSWMKKSSDLRDRVRMAETLSNAPADAPLSTADDVLRNAARDRWYVPNPNQQGDVDKLRERDLLADFDRYRNGREVKIKNFRLEAVRAGFKMAWAERDYALILAVADKLPDDALYGDQKLLMWVDMARTRTDDRAV